MPADPWIHSRHFNAAAESHFDYTDATNDPEQCSADVPTLLLDLAEEGYCPACLWAGISAFPHDVQGAFMSGFTLAVFGRKAALPEQN